MFLVKERPLLRLFELRCRGLSKPHELAARLRIEVRAIENLQKKLERRWSAFSVALTALNRSAGNEKIFERNDLMSNSLEYQRK
jgi:hypothetical protein